MTKTTNSDSNAQFDIMTQKPVASLIVRLAIPTIVSMMITGIYNMADTFFVSRLGTSASAAVGISFSLMAIIQAIGFTLGMGAGSLVSLNLGRRNKEYADKYASSAFFAALISGVILTICGLFFLRPLMLKLGSTETILPYSSAYAKYIFYRCTNYVCIFCDEQYTSFGRTCCFFDDWTYFWRNT